MAGESPAKTNYLYMTYNGDEHDLEFDNSGTMVLGSGCYRIGSSVEFDWCSVSAIRTLKKMGKRSVMVNYNPETVSTDYDECDRLYFEELSLERVLDIYEQEGVDNVMVSVGGQIPNTLALDLHKNDVNIVGTSAVMIDNAEDRDKFSKTCDDFGIDQPEWSKLSTVEEAFDFADKVGYPVLVRPSYILSGAAINVAYSAAELNENLKVAGEISSKHPVVLTKFIMGAREIDIDAVAHNGKVVVHAMSEHVENAGVHSGDATLVLPPYTIDEATQKKCREVAAKVAEALQVNGPFNMQLIASPDGSVKIIETNLRASRSLPFSSKSVGVDFVEVATHVMLEDKVPETKYQRGLEDKYPQTYYGVKAPMFSFKRLANADPTIGVEMASTGEVACYGETVEEAMLKSYLSTLQFRMPNRKKVLVSVQEKLREDFLPALTKLDNLGYTLYATEETAKFLAENGFKNVVHLNWDENKEPSISHYIKEQKLDMVLMFSNHNSKRTETNYEIRRLAVDFNIPLITDPNVASKLADAIDMKDKGMVLQSKTLKDYYEAEDKNSL